MAMSKTEVHVERKPSILVQAFIGALTLTRNKSFAEAGL